MKSVIKKFLPLLLVQLLIVFFFAYCIIDSQPIDISDTKQIDITVDDMYKIHRHRGTWVAVVADSTEYIFQTGVLSEEYSTSKLYQTISKGDNLSLIYYETDRILFRGKTNIVVDARTETEIYRSFEVFNRNRQNTPILIAIVFSIIELILIGVVFLNVWLDYKTIRSVYRNARKRRLKNGTGSTGDGTLS